MEKPDQRELMPRGDIRRKPGAQPGNVNAWKHGFYSRRFKALELADLETVMQDSLDDEIALLRVMIRRVFTFANEEARTLDSWSKSLSVLGAACTRLAGLMRTQHMTTGGADPLEDILAKALGEAAHEVSERYNRK